MSHESLSDVLQKLHDTLPRGQDVSVGEIIESMEARGFGIFLIIFALPLCVPIPKPPPIDTILGVPLMVIAWQMIRGYGRPRLPMKILERRLKADFLVEALRRGLPWLRKAEKMFKPRLDYLFSEKSIRLFGIMTMVLALSVLVPVPTSNTFPSICVVVMAVGLSERDYLAAIGAGVAGVIFVFGLATVVTWAAMKAWGVITI